MPGGFGNRGIEGMILAASNEDSGVYLVGPDSDAIPGMKVS